jgi:hypothetical protein
LAIGGSERFSQQWLYTQDGKEIIRDGNTGEAEGLPIPSELVIAGR